MLEKIKTGRTCAHSWSAWTANPTVANQTSGPWCFEIPILWFPKLALCPAVLRCRRWRIALPLRLLGWCWLPFGSVKWQSLEWRSMLFCVFNKEKGKNRKRNKKGVEFSSSSSSSSSAVVVAVPFVFGQDVHDQHWRQRLCRGNMFQCLNDVRFAVGRFFHTHGGVVRQNLSPQVAVTVA